MISLDSVSELQRLAKVLLVNETIYRTER
jgi:hypothetical protein